MASGLNHIEGERRTVLGLWAVPGVGSKSIAAIQTTFEDLASLADVYPHEWLRKVDLPEQARRALASAPKPGVLADRAVERCLSAGISIAFQGDEAYPSRLAEVGDAPPLLFYKGRVGPPRRRLALVGTRRPDMTTSKWAREFAQRVAAKGLGVVSGAADGIDQQCHLGALDVGGETWAFLGSALDEIDPSQKRLWRWVEAGGGVYFSELPPGVRADRSTFPRRNRLISGAADAVVILRAPEGSGALYTAEYAEAQGRPILVVPGDVSNDSTRGGNAWLRAGRATACLDVGDALAAVGMDRALSGPPPKPTAPRVDVDSLSASAQAALRVVDRTPRGFEELLLASRVESGTLSSALCELELLGLVVQHPGKRYERL
ncbi:MAG: DNA-processing protein DprA [Myxococcota bacterium]